MSAKTFLSVTQAHRLRAILEVAEVNGTQSEAAIRAGMSRQGLVGFLWREIGRGHWLPDIERIRALLTLPVVPDSEARATWSRRNGRQHLAGAQGMARVEPGPMLDHVELEARIARVEASRRAHENLWLAAERERWGQTRQTRVGPMSGMPA